jgi:hypothetical protein
MKRVAQILGVALVVLGVFGAAFEGSHGLGALWEHWWCLLPLALIAAGVASVIAAPRLGRTA